MNPEDGSSSKRSIESSVKRKEDIKRQWTRLLLDWVKVCGHAHTTLDKVDFMDLVKMYGDDLFVESQPLPEALERFLEERFPKLDIKLSDMTDPWSLYIVATVLLFHCITNGPVNAVISICLYLTLDQQTLIQKFCEQLMDVEITASAVDAAIDGAFESTSNSDVMDQNEESSFELFEIERETSESVDISIKADSINTLFLKSLFDIKSSATNYPDKTFSETKNITDSLLSARVGSDNTQAMGSGMVIAEVCHTQEGRTEKESQTQDTVLLKEQDVDPIKLEESDINMTLRKTYTRKKGRQDKSQMIEKSSKSVDTEVTIPVNYSPKEKTDTLFLKSLFAVKSSICRHKNTRSVTKNDVGVTFLSTIAPKQYRTILQSKIETIPECLKELDHELMKTKISSSHAPSHPKSALVTPVTNNPTETTTGKATAKNIEAPITDDRSGMDRNEFDTLYFNSPFNVKSSQFDYTGITESVTMETLTNTKPKTATKGASRVITQKQFSIKEVNNKDNKMSNTPASSHSSDLKPRKHQGSGLKSKLCVIEDEEEEVQKVHSFTFTEPKVDLESEELITEDQAKAIDILYRKSVFCTKSSQFGYSGRISSETKNCTNVSLLTTVTFTHGIKSDEVTTKLDTDDKVGRKTVYKPKNASELKKPDLDRKTSNLKAALGKVHTSEENTDSSKINTYKSQCKPVTFKQPDPKPEVPITGSPIVNIGTLFMKFPFTVKSSAYEYINKIKAKTKTVTKKTLPKTNKIADILKNSLVTTVKDIGEENKNNESVESNRESGEPSTVIEKRNKPSGVIVEVANIVSQKDPFTCKPSALKYPGTSSEKNIRVRDKKVYAGDGYYVANFISDVSSQLASLNSPIALKKGSKSSSKSKLKSDEPNAENPKKSRKGLTQFKKMSKKMWITILVVLGIVTTLAITIPYALSTKGDAAPYEYPDIKNALRRYNIMDEEEKKKILINMNMSPNNKWLSWECKNGLCQRVYQPHMMGPYESHSRCTLLCSGPQLWPHPIGHKFFGNKIVVLTTSGIQYSHKNVPSQEVKEYLDAAFTLFQMDLVRQAITEPKEKQSLDLAVKKLHIEFDVESDPDPRLRLDTEESYTLSTETTDVIKVKIRSPSFCGARHGLETLSQLILLDQRTGYLITLEHANVEDAPSYKYRGLMVDTARNYIPVGDLSRTIDAMAMCKLNTFHWRISDAASFPMVIPDYPQLFEYGAYSREMVYTPEDIKYLVERAGFRGIRILIEVAAPGPVGRGWSWATDAYTPPAKPTKDKTSSASDVLCLRLKMHESTFDVLEAIYTYIIKLTKVHDIFHLSNGLFSFVNCSGLIEDRDHFLDRALNRLRTANDGSLPRLPLIWYNVNLMSTSAWSWHNFGIQLHDEDLPETVLSKYKLIQSSRWDLSCEMKKHRCVRYRTWQQMYNWRAWRDMDVMTIEGGEAVLWTDLVDRNNLDSHLWPRTAAVAERLWSDAVANKTASAYEYLRLDAQRWRMLIRGVKAQTVWPVWCSFNPGQCFNKINT